MQISYSWIRSYFEKKIPTPKEIASLLTVHSFEVESVENTGEDSLFDVKILPDRAHDCLSVLGVAKEISLLTNLSIKSEILNPKKLSVPESNVAKVEVEDQNLCRRFSALVLEDIEVGPSPSWLRERLEAVGQKSINNIVDATNYVMFETGQPLHAYDRALLDEGDGLWRLVARNAKEKEVVSALDQKEYILNSENVVIADGNSGKALGIAGIKGGGACKIDDSTKDIVLEAANFDPVSIRKTAKSLGLRTEASVRFENEISPELTEDALKRVADIIFSVAGTEKTRIEGLCDFYPRKANPYKVGVSLSEIKDILGIEIKQDEVEGILNRRRYEWEIVKPRKKIVEIAKSVLGTPYKFGSSVSYDSPQTFDCSSLTAWLYVQVGLAIPRIAAEQYAWGREIDEKQLLPGDLVFFTGQRTDIPKETVGHNGVYIGDGEFIHAGGIDLGYGKVIKEKIIDSKYYKTGFRGYRKFVEEDEDRFVVTIAPERLDLRIKEDLVEEIGRIYGYENIKSKPIEAKKCEEINKLVYYSDKVREIFLKRGFSEVLTYTFKSKGDRELENPVASDKSFLRSNLRENIKKAVDLNIHNVDLLGEANVKIFEIGNVFPGTDEHLSLSFTISGKGNEVMIDEIKRELEYLFGHEFSLIEDGGIWELNLEESIKTAKDPSDFVDYFRNDAVKYTPYSVFPFIVRDIAILTSSEIKQSEIEKLIVENAGDLLVRHGIFDVYEMQDAMTSTAVRLILQSADRTLRDEEANLIIETIVKAITEKGWEVR